MIDPMPSRPRRNRSSAAMRDLMREIQVNKTDLIYPVFVREGSGTSEEIGTMPVSTGIPSITWFGIWMRLWNWEFGPWPCFLFSGMTARIALPVNLFAKKV